MSVEASMGRNINDVVEAILIIMIYPTRTPLGEPIYDEDDKTLENGS
jgi:hypothetical protein